MQGTRIDIQWEYSSVKMISCMGILGRGLVVDHVSVGSSHIIDLVIFAPGHHLFCCSLGGLMKGTKEKEVWRFLFIKTLQFFGLFNPAYSFPLFLFGSANVLSLGGVPQRTVSCDRGKISGVIDIGLCRGSFAFGVLFTCTKRLLVNLFLCFDLVVLTMLL